MRTINVDETKLLRGRKPNCFKEFELNFSIARSRNQMHRWTPQTGWQYFAAYRLTGRAQSSNYWTASRAESRRKVPRNDLRKRGRSSKAWSLFYTERDYGIHGLLTSESRLLKRVAERSENFSDLQNNASKRNSLLKKEKIRTNWADKPFFLEPGTNVKSAMRSSRIPDLDAKNF